MSKPSRSLAVVGANEDTIAHLRLLMRMGTNRLAHDWRWGAEHEADFVVVEPGALASDTIQTRCQAAGIPFAVLCDADDVVVQGMALRRPLKLEQIVAVLNAAGTSSTTAAPVQAFGDDFYTQSLGDTVPTGTPPADVWAGHERTESTSPSPREPAVPDLDHLLFGNPLEEPVERGPLVTPDTEVAASESTSRSERRRDDADMRLAASLVGVSAMPHSPPPPRGAEAPVLRTAATLKKLEDPPRPLLDFLEGDGVASPTQLCVEDLPVITLDPKQRVFHATGSLAGLGGYVERGVQHAQTRAVAGAELARVRLTERARSYDELRWLTALLRAGGNLSSRLDPGGTYAVHEPLALDPDFHDHAAITAVMHAPARLHEIAQRSGAPMAHVFDIVNAYEAIGRLEWKPRPPRAAPTPETKPATSQGRWKWPFGRG